MCKFRQNILNLFVGFNRMVTSLISYFWNYMKEGPEKISHIISIIIFPLICITFVSSCIQSKGFNNQLKNSNILSIYQATDRCIYLNDLRGGDRLSYEYLLNIKIQTEDNEVKEIINSQLKFLKSFYKNSAQYAGDTNKVWICREHVVCGAKDGKETRNNYDLKHVLEHAKINIYPKFSTRVAVAYLFGSTERYKKFNDCEKKKVISALIKLMDKNSEISLLVNKTALDSFKSLMPEFEDDTLFAFELAIIYGEKYKKSLQCKK